MSKCLNKNTVFYKNLVDLNYTKEQILQINLQIESEKFKEWYGEGQKDTFEQPKIINTVYLENDKGEQIRLKDLLNDEFFEKRKHYSQDLTYIDKIVKFLDDEQIALSRRISKNRGTKYAKKVELLLDEIRELLKIDTNKALAKYYEHVLTNVTHLELRLHTIDKEITDKSSKYQKNYKIFLEQSLNFLNSYSKITNLETPQKAGEVRTLILKLKTLENRVSDLENKVRDRLETEIRDTLTPLIKNPKVREGVIDFLAAQVDENKAQFLLDAMGDSHNIFVSAIWKYFASNMAHATDESKKLAKEWKEFIKKPQGGFDNFIKRISEMDSDGERTGRYVQEWKEEFYDKIYDFNERLRLLRDAGKKNTKEYNDILNEYFNWKGENQEQKFAKEYYDALKLLTPEARQAKVEIDNAKNIILLRGKDKLTDEDFETLRDLDEQARQLKSSINPDGTPKTGKDLEIAESLYKYTKGLSKFYEIVRVDQEGFKRARKVAEEKGVEELEKFDYNNTSEQFNSIFWGKFNDLIAELPKAKSIDNLNTEIGQLLIGYKNERGEVEVETVPKEILDKVEDLEKQKSVIKSEMNKSVNIHKKREIANRFKSLIKYVPTTYYLNLLASKKKQLENKEITQEEYNKWYKDNHYTDPYTEEIEPIKLYTVMKPRNPELIEQLPNKLWTMSDVKKQYLNPDYKEDVNGYGIPKNQWKNPVYDNLSEKDKEYLQEYKDFIHNIVKHDEGNLLDKGYFPVIRKDESKKYKTEENRELIINESNEVIKFIPFKYVNKIIEQELPEFPENGTEEENKKIAEERKKIRDKNRKFHGKAISYDLAKNMETFIKVATINKYKKEMELDINLFREQFKRNKIIVTTPKGENYFDKIKSRFKGEKSAYEVSGIGSNVERKFLNWLDIAFYEDGEYNEGKFSSVTNAIVDISSLKNIGFNVFSAVNNTVIGNMQSRLESFGGRYYDYKQYRKAKWLYYKNVTTYIADHYSKKSTNYLSAFLKDFDVIISQDELSNKPDGLAKTLRYKARLAQEAGFLLQEIGEHQIQNTALIAMAQSHRIIDGEILSFNEFYEKKKFKVDWKVDLDAAFKAMEQNEELKKTLQAEFESYTSIFDAYEFRDGDIHLKDDVKVSRDAIHEFKFRVIGMNQRLHGIYNKEDSSVMQRYALGRLAMQFRKYARPNWNRKFGKRFGKRDYNERIRDYEEGQYVTFSKYLASPFADTYQKYKNQQMNMARKSFRILVESFEDILKNTRVRWHSMDEIEKSNVRKTFGELLFLVTVIALGFLLKSIKDGDDDDEGYKKKFLTWALYQSDRLFGEMTTFNVGLVREGNRIFKSPAASLAMLSDIGTLAYNVGMYPFRDEEDRVFKGGVHYGEDKIETYFSKFVPLYNQYVKWYYLEDNNQKYGMFK